MHFLPVHIAAGVILVNVGTFIARSLVSGLLTLAGLDQTLYGDAAVLCVRFAAMILLYCLFVRWFEKRPAQEILPDRKAPAEFGAGFLLGAGIIGMLVTVLVLAGMASPGGLNTWQDFPQHIMTDLFFAFLQDVIYFLILFRLVEKSAGSLVAMIVTGFVFGFKHLLFPDYGVWAAAAIVIEGGILFSALFMLYRRVWMVFGFHFAYNVIQNTFLGYVNPAGNRAGVLDFQVSGPAVWTGSRAGLESSVIALILSLAAGGLLLAVEVRKGHWKRMPRRNISE